VDPFQTHCYAENLIVQEIVPGTSGFAARKLITRSQRLSYICIYICVCVCVTISCCASPQLNIAHFFLPTAPRNQYLNIQSARITINSTVSVLIFFEFYFIRLCLELVDGTETISFLTCENRGSIFDNTQTEGLTSATWAPLG
jgi:hypothetical protein